VRGVMLSSSTTRAEAFSLINSGRR
jgi:hypothetical protein